MHDPMTVAFTIHNRLARPKTWGSGRKSWPHLITIWHVDPEKGGSDDSCDWFGKRRPLNKREAAFSDAVSELLHTLGNEPFYPHPRLHGRGPDDDSLVRDVRRARYEWGRRRLRWHPRWHVWHWKIQVHPVQHFKRWAFSRCRECGGRFNWGYAPVSGNWYGVGPKWFRNLEHVYHSECHGEMTRRVAAEAAVDRAGAIIGGRP